MFTLGLPTYLFALALVGLLVSLIVTCKNKIKAKSDQNEGGEKDVVLTSA